MVEILFGESEAGAMKLARKSCSRFGDIIALPLMLDVGDIRQPVLGKYRRCLIYRMLYREQWGGDEKMRAELKALGNKYSRELMRLKEYLKRGEPLRIWYSDAPYSMCGFMWLCSRLKRYRGKVYAVKLPHIVVRCDKEKSGYGVFRDNWGEAEPSEFVEALPLQRLLSSLEIGINGIEWRAAESRDSLLRAVVNGCVTSVPESFYDFLIWDAFRMNEKHGNASVRQAELIGSILSRHSGIGDWWYAYRIDMLIEKGDIKIVENSPKRYERKIAGNSDA